MSVSRPSFLSLPTELRLQCLGYVFEQPPDTGFNRASDCRGLTFDVDYSASAQLSVLLTCRQFRSDFTPLAFRKTIFVLIATNKSLFARLQPLQDRQLVNLRKIAFVATHERVRELLSWEPYPFHTENIHLEELTLALDHLERWHSQYTKNLVAVIRRLRNVEVVRFVRNVGHDSDSFSAYFNRFVGFMLKEDHYHRYDAPNAPHVEANWWAWSHQYSDCSFLLVAQPPKPLMPETEYLEMTAPMIRNLMSEMEEHEGVTLA